MKKIFFLAFLLTTLITTAFPQSNSRLLGLWKNGGKSFLLETGGKGTEIFDHKTSITDKCNCITSMKFPFKWFVSHDTLFTIYDIEKFSLKASAAAKPGVIANINEIESANSLCLTPVQYVFSQEKSEYNKTPNRRWKFSIVGKDLMFGNVKYTKEDIVH